MQRKNAAFRLRSSSHVVTNRDQITSALQEQSQRTKIRQLQDWHSIKRETVVISYPSDTKFLHHKHLVMSFVFVDWQICKSVELDGQPSTIRLLHHNQLKINSDQELEDGCDAVTCSVHISSFFFAKTNDDLKIESHHCIRWPFCGFLSQNHPEPVRSCSSA